MNREANDHAGPITRFLVEDHQRLDGLLQAAVTATDRIDRQVYDRFRAGLLRHIGMEEKILLPAAQRLRGGQALPIAAKLRLDHGAIAALLMPTPTAAIIATIRGILQKHNVVEEGPDGLYETCDDLAGAEAVQLVAKLESAPEPAVMPHSDTPAVMSAVRRAMERAGYGSND
jgi:hypothetical protein